MLTMNDLNPLLRRRSTVITGEGDKVGTVGVVYLNDVDEQPTWVTVHTGLFGSRESFVPLEGASVRGHDLVVDYPRELIRHAPSVDRDGHLSPEEEAALYRHYGMQAVAPPREPRPDGDAVAASPAVASTAATAVGSPGAASAAGPVARVSAVPAPATTTAASNEPPAPSVAEPRTTVSPSSDEPGASSATGEALREHDGRGSTGSPAAPVVPDTVPTAAPATESTVEPSEQSNVRTHDDGGTPWVVRSEERLRVGTEQYEAGRVRLRKYVVTEEEAVSVPLVTEQVRVVVEPITSAAAVDLGTVFREESVELVAWEEIAVVGKETVAVERVRMSTVEVAGRATVRDTVRKERISVAVDGDAAKDVDGSDRTPARRTRSGKAKAKAGTSSRTAPGQPVKDAAGNAVKNTNALVKGKKKRR